MAADQNSPNEQYRKPNRRDIFLATMERIVPWESLCSVIEPHHPKAGNGRPSVGLEHCTARNSRKADGIRAIHASNESRRGPGCRMKQ